MRTANFAQNLLSVQTELRHFAYKLTADREDANDLLQETSLKVLDNEDKYTDETNFKGWVYTIMRNILSIITVRHNVTRLMLTRLIICFT